MIIEEQHEQSAVGVILILDKLFKHIFSVKRPQTLKFEARLLKTILVPKTIHQEPQPLNVWEASEKCHHLVSSSPSILSSEFLISVIWGCSLAFWLGFLLCMFEGKKMGKSKVCPTTEHSVLFTLLWCSINCEYLKRDLVLP